MDGVNIFPKLPIHFRMHLKQWLKNKRIENSIKAAKPGAEKLNKINNILSPFYSKESTTTLPETSEELKHQEVSFPAVVRPPVMPQPSQQAMHHKLYTVVDGILVGENPGSRGGHKHKARRKPRKCQKCVDMGMYEQNPGHRCAALGRGRECDFFDDSYRRRCWRCWKHGLGMIDPHTCPATKGDRDGCNEFWPSVEGKCRPKRSKVD